VRTGGISEQLVKKVSVALKDAGGAAEEYQALHTELQQLQLLLEQIRDLPTSSSSSLIITKSFVEWHMRLESCQGTEEEFSMSSLMSYKFDHERAGAGLSRFDLD
jgi:hypothetical protein